MSMQLMLYDDGARRASVDVSALVGYCGEVTHCRVVGRDGLVQRFVRSMEGGRCASEVRYCAEWIARSRVHDPGRRCSPAAPHPMEIDYEKRKLKGERLAGAVYDGSMLQELFARCIPSAELGWRYLHVVLSDRLVATWEGDEHRYHARTVVLGYPNIVSIPGIIEGPARSRDYYLGMQLGLTLAGGGRERISAALKGEALEYDDGRLTEVVKGLILQAFFYHVFGEVFCAHGECRLYNARWQSELLQAQCGKESGLCSVHASLLSSFVEKSMQRNRSRG